MDKITAIHLDEYSHLIDPDFIESVESICNNCELKTDFKIAYLILHFHLSESEQCEKSVLLGDLFISILTERLIGRNRDLLGRIIDRISHCHSENILWRVRSFKHHLLHLLEEVIADGGSFS